MPTPRPTCAWPARALLAGDPRTNAFAAEEVSAVARALIAAGSLDEGTARSVFDEYTVAVSVRQAGPPPGRWANRRPPSGNKVDLSASRAVTGRFRVGDEKAGLLLKRLVFTDESAHIELSGTVGDRVGNALAIQGIALDRTRSRRSRSWTTRAPPLRQPRARGTLPIRAGVPPL